MNNIKIIQTHLPTSLSEESFFDLIEEFPKNLQEYILEFKHLNDCYLSAVGYTLLAYMLKPYNISLHSLDRDENNRPFIQEFEGDFNISHSHQSVICTVVTKGQVGVDIEYIRDLELEVFKEQFSVRQWQGIITDNNSLVSFFNAWCKKEAIVKLDGRGLGIALAEIPLMRAFRLNNEQIYCQNIDAGSPYSAAIAYNFEEKLPPVSVLDYKSILNKK